jgi:HK97 family phage major capsid protein/HK97 family phage prohead protease
MTQKHFDAGFELKFLGEAGVFEGYAAVFNVIDSVNDIITPGAFRDIKRLPPLLWQHNAAEPMGAWREVYEDSRGLYVKGELFINDIPLAREAYKLLRENVVTGLSIGYRVKESHRDPETGARILTKLDLLEVSLVTFPANDLARVLGVKSQQNLTQKGNTNMTKDTTAVAVSDLGRAFESFKEANDQRLREIERKGAADPLTELKVNRLNERFDQLETALQRSPREGMKPDDHKEAEIFARERKGHFHGELDLHAYRQYKSALGHYLRKNNAGNNIDEIKALSVGSDPDGGFAVPPDMNGRIASLILETSPMRQVANVVTIGSDALEGVNDLSDAGSGWVGETEARSETTTPKIGEWRIPVFEQYAEPRATQKLLDDALFNVEDYLAGKIADRLSRMENAAFINGNGVKKPRGILTYAAGVPSASNFAVVEQVPTGGAGAFASSNPGDALINLVYSLKASYRDKAVFMMKRATLAEIRKLKDGNGNYLWQPDFQTKQGGTLLGFNVVEAEDMPAIAANSLSVAFGDFNAGYQIVDRQGIRILRDAFTAKPYVKFYTTKRVGGDLVNFEALKLLKFATS